MMSNIENEMPKKVAFYLRVSTDDQADFGYGIDLQKQSLNSLLQSKGQFPNGKDRLISAGEQYIYTDEGISGTKLLSERPAFSRLQEDIINSPEGTRPFDVVAVFKIDRFARKLRILLDVLDFLEKYDLEFISAHESIDTATPFGKAMIGIVGVLSELELENIKLRTHLGRNEATENGVFMGTCPPYGYNKDQNKRLEILEVQARVVRNIFSYYVEDRLSLFQIATKLKEQQEPSPDVSDITYKKRKGSPRKTKNDIYFWNVRILRQILSNEIYVGRYYYNKTRKVNGKTRALPQQEWQLSKYKHSPIIEEVKFYKAQKLFKSASTSGKSHAKRNHVYLLSGLLKCADCFDKDRDVISGMQTLTGATKEITKGSGSYSHYYICRRKNTAKTTVRCYSLPLPAEQIESYVIDRIKELIEDPSAVYEYQRNLQSSRASIKHLEEERDSLIELINKSPKVEENLKEQHSGGYLSFEDLKRKISDLEIRSNQNKNKLKEISYKLSQQDQISGYIKSFDYFKGSYKQVLEDIPSNRNEAQKLLHSLVECITVYSRPLKDTDSVSGRKSSTQHIPYRIDIQLRLPEQFIYDYIEKRKKEPNSFSTGIIELKDDGSFENLLGQFVSKKPNWWDKSFDCEVSPLGIVLTYDDVDVSLVRIGNRYSN